MKGKKFSAAEKHFEKKRLQYEKRISSINEQLDSAHRDTRLFRGRYELAERENEELKNWLERLLEYTELSKDDIRQACDKDKKMSEAAD